jgi:hypothetical protein
VTDELEDNDARYKAVDAKGNPLPSAPTDLIDSDHTKFYDKDNDSFTLGKNLPCLRNKLGAKDRTTAYALSLEGFQKNLRPVGSQQRVDRHAITVSAHLFYRQERQPRRVSNDTRQFCDSFLARNNDPSNRYPWTLLEFGKKNLGQMPDLFLVHPLAFSVAIHEVRSLPDHAN